MYVEISNAVAAKDTTDRLGQLLGEEDPRFFAEVEAVIGKIEWVNLRMTPMDGGHTRVMTMFGDRVGDEGTPTKTVGVQQDGDDADDFYASRDAILTTLMKLRQRSFQVTLNTPDPLFDNEEPIPGRADSTPTPAPAPAPAPAHVEPVIQAAPSRPEVHIHIHVLS